MYLDYETYVEFGGVTWSEDDYATAEQLAELIMDDVTLNRLQSIDWSTYEHAVQRAMLVILETLPALNDAYSLDTSGQGLSSFSNGVDSFSFANAEDGEADAIRSALYKQLMSMLPVPLCSACVGYNHAS